MKVMRKIIEIDEELCDGCGMCVPACAEGAIQIIDGKAKLVQEKYCDGLGACLGDCPKGALKIVEREAEEFDEDAVEEYLQAKEKESKGSIEASLACGCPSTLLQQFDLGTTCGCEEANIPRTQERQESQLSHWPVQIKLVPPHAPFLKDADLIVLADCVGIAYPNLHEDFIKNNVIMIGCPKFDDVDEYVYKFKEIFQKNSPRSLKVVIMEVPCCSGLPMIVKKGMELAGKNMPIKLVTVGTRGNILEERDYN